MLIAIAAGIAAGMLSGVAVAIGVKKGNGADIAPALVGIIISFVILSISLIGVKLFLPGSVLPFGIFAVLVFLAVVGCTVALLSRKD